MADECDRAAEAADEHLKHALNAHHAARGPDPDWHDGRAYCLDCGDDCTERAEAINAARCFDCQTDHESGRT